MLLAVAAFQGAKELVGVDIHAESFIAGITSNFEHLELPIPSQIYQGDIKSLVNGDIPSSSSSSSMKPLLQKLNSNDLADLSFDAIITDPPYDMKTKALIKDTSASTNDDPMLRSTKSIHLMLQILLKVASRKLKKNGRLVCFVPVRQGTETGRKGQGKVQDTRLPLEDEGEKSNDFTTFDRQLNDQAIVDKRLNDHITVDKMNSEDYSANDENLLATLGSIPTNIHLYSAHRQALSPTFSRWLCIFIRHE